MVNFFSLTRPKRKISRTKRSLKLKKAKPKVLRSRKKRAVSAKVSAKKPSAKKETPIGEIVHYFPKVHAGVIKITKGAIVLGDQLHFKGHTTNFKQTASSIQINRVPIKKAKVGDEIGILVNSRVRAGDLVYKVK